MFIVKPIYLSPETAIRMLDEDGDDFTLINSEINQHRGEHLSFLACSTAKECIDKLLTSFLVLNSIHSPDNTNTSALMAQCAELDNTFLGIDLSCLHCTSTEKVKTCLAVAEEVKEMVERKLRKG